MIAGICFVCLGNICRSPTAEAVFGQLARERGAASSFAVESAGTAAHHADEGPDPRSVAAAKARGIVLKGFARRFERQDFARFDHVIAMDRRNREDLRRLAADADPVPSIALLREWDPRRTGPEALDVPDPYYNGLDGFEEVLDICLRSCAALLEDLCSASLNPTA